jgi:hypothetical protein
MHPERYSGAGGLTDEEPRGVSFAGIVLVKRQEDQGLDVGEGSGESHAFELVAEEDGEEFLLQFVRLGGAELYFQFLGAEDKHHQERRHPSVISTEGVCVRVG